jgi:hypothetical protein
MDSIIVKYDASGNMIWKKTYGGTQNDMFYECIIATDGGIVVSGASDSTDVDIAGLNKGGTDGIVVKYDTDGNIIWNQNFGGSAEEELAGVTEVPGCYLVCGASESTDGDLAGLTMNAADGVIIMYDTNGNKVLIENYGGTAQDSIIGITPNVAIGESTSNDGIFTGLNYGDQDGFIMGINLIDNSLTGTISYDTTEPTTGTVTAILTTNKLINTPDRLDKSR